MTTNNIDKIFKSGLENHSAEVPESVWERVEQQVSGRSSNRRVWFAAASVALLLGVGAAWLSTGGSQPEPQTAGATVDTTMAPQLAPAQIDYAPNYADSAVYVGE